MTTNELKKEHTEKWRKENPTKYTVWLICYMGDLIPLVIMLTQLMGPMNDKKAGDNAGLSGGCCGSVHHRPGHLLGTGQGLESLPGGQPPQAKIKKRAGKPRLVSCSRS